jgi:hypothetical protein
MNDKPTGMFQNACSYSKAAGVLNELALGRQSSPRLRDLCLPSAVNAALALELFLKTLYFLEKGEDFRVNGKHSHDFHRLFGQLDVQRRQKMEAIFAQKLSNRNMSDVEQMERASSIPVPRDLVGNLNSWKDVFVRCRYAHEPQGRPITMFFFPEIEDSVSEAILTLRPELTPTYLARLG